MTDILDDGCDSLAVDMDVAESGGSCPAAPGMPGAERGAAREVDLTKVVVIVVGFRNPEDIVSCLRALSRLRAAPPFDVFIAENGGAEGVAALHAALLAPASPCRLLADAHPAGQHFAELEERTFTLQRPLELAETCVRLLRMPENLGYAGAINACLRPLMLTPGWQAAWILNPDTEPAPSSLRELADYADARRKGMVGSRITGSPGTDVRFCGLKWSKLTASTAAIGVGDTPGEAEPDLDAVEAMLDAPSGASIYVTRALMERIGLMDERYFLYFEDLDWGCRAKRLGALGYAHRSVVPHKGGTTIGSARTRAGRSRLSVYLEFRNRILFVRDTHKGWLAWTVLMQTAHLAAFVGSGSIGNMVAAGQGVLAGLRREVGRPDHVLRAHKMH